MSIPDGYNSHPDMTGQNNADNQQSSSEVTPNEDGTNIERLEALKVQLAAISTTDLGAMLTAIEGSGFVTGTDSLEAISEALATANAALTLTGDALETQVLSTKTFYKDNAQTKLTGTAVSTALESKIETLESTQKKIVTIYLNQIVTSVGDAAALKAGITIATDGVNYAALDAADTVSITGGSTLVITFDSALSTATNLIKIASGTVKDVFSIENVEVITSAIDAT